MRSIQKYFAFSFFMLTLIFLGCKKEQCANGVKDSDETGIDCGGSCTPCVYTPDSIISIQNLSGTWYLARVLHPQYYQSELGFTREIDLYFDSTRHQIRFLGNQTNNGFLMLGSLDQTNLYPSVNSWSFNKELTTLNEHFKVQHFNGEEFIIRDTTSGIEYTYSRIQKYKSYYNQIRFMIGLWTTTNLDSIYTIETYQYSENNGDTTLDSYSKSYSLDTYDYYFYNDLVYNNATIKTILKTVSLNYNIPNLYSLSHTDLTPSYFRVQDTDNEYLLNDSGISKNFCVSHSTDNYCSNYSSSTLAENYHWIPFDQHNGVLFSVKVNLRND